MGNIRANEAKVIISIPVGQLSFLCLRDTECTLDLRWQTPAVSCLKAPVRGLGCDWHCYCAAWKINWVFHTHSTRAHSVLPNAQLILFSELCCGILLYMFHHLILHGHSFCTIIPLYTSSTYFLYQGQEENSSLVSFFFFFWFLLMNWAWSRDDICSCLHGYSNPV